MDVSILSLGDLVTDPVTGERMTAAEKHQLAVDQAVAAEEAGLRAIYIGEHHALEYVYSCPPVILSAISQRTKRLRLGTGVTLLANLDPVRVAEDYGTLDVLSNGRVEIVGGRGNIFPSVYELFGQPIEESQERFEENLRLLLDIWTNPVVNWEGKFRPAIRDQKIEPVPLQRPRPPVWIGGGLSTSSAELCAALGLPLMLPVTTFQPASMFEPAAQHYRESWKAAGHEQPCRIGATVHATVAATSQEARKLWAPRYTAYHDWSRKAIHSTGAKPAFLTGFDFDALIGPGGSAVGGSPAEVVDKIGWLSELLGVDSIVLYLDMGGIPKNELLTMIERVGSEVIPALK
ncbi:LLM class flavin-dependent oxidoreductase [Amycolatopsis sp.]|jgi:alkanesulfonate monooxygenase SsuD/methylene tetrahydromethanopterin reductase-like flavin-dependent oxidoreductase (luciferase family)|uniref:LLM class flavin-dependent oxidoreductase n=1 Tax=Amycolatopsis sp. TaxID=37632 RepID=UPI002DFE9A2A|nr:LLM class flavin-dependent oxidoreductase [Amycolatopsis sp.]